MGLTCHPAPLLWQQGFAAISKNTYLSQPAAYCCCNYSFPSGSGLVCDGTHLGSTLACLRQMMLQTMGSKFPGKMGNVDACYSVLPGPLPSYSLQAGCCVWNTNYRIPFGESLIWRPSLKCFPSSWRINRWVLLWPALQLYEIMMQIGDKELPGSEKETALLRDKLCPLQSSNFSGSTLNSTTVPCSLECSLTRCNLCSNSSLKLQRNCWIYPAVTQRSFSFCLDLPGACSFATPCTNTKYQIFLLLKTYKKRCFTQMDEIYFTFLLVMKLVHCLIDLSPSLRRSV